MNHTEIRGVSDVPFVDNHCRINSKNILKSLLAINLQVFRDCIRSNCRRQDEV